ncbi:Tail fiber protein [Pseudomonas sp. IT-P44]|uniref:phage tail protein n=1 Tax=Pseudomonas sp. IT-P44 TaxID=3026451 RepID=UPI0039E026D8
MGASITLAGESLIAQKQAAQLGLEVTRFIFANVPGLDPNGPVDRAAPKPAAGQIVHVYDIPDGNAGYVNPNQVVYSAQIGSDVGDWDFNWIGLEAADGELFAVAYVALQQKRRNIPPLQIGNNLTRNFLVAFDGAQALTGISIDASTWQHDFTVRLAGIDERERQSNRDVYGRACFFGSSLQVEKVGGVYQVKTGTAYVEGIRLVRSAVLPIVPPAFPTTAWLDVALQRELSDVVASWQVVFAADRPDYSDSAGVKHYCVAIADLPNANTLIDRRPVEAIGGPLVQHFAARVGDYEKLRARATTKDDVDLGNLPNAKSDDPAVSDSEVLATTKMVRAALDQQDAKNSVLFTTTAPVVLSGLALQAGGDWATALPAGARVLVKEQANGSANGIYNVAANGWTRSADADTDLEVTPGLFVHVEQGATLADSLWRLTTDGPITLNTTPLVFEMEAGRTGAAGGIYDLLTINARGQVIGGSRQKVTAALTVDTALSASHRGLVLLDASAGDRMFTLPASNTALGMIDLIVRRVDNTANRLTVKAAGADKVKFHTHLTSAGYGFFYLMGAGDWWHLVSDGAGGWLPVGRLDSAPLGRPTFETTIAFQPGGNGPLGGVLYNRSEWPWLWDHAQTSGMLTSEALRAGLEGGWTSGDGLSTFRGPTGTGEFVRIADDVGRLERPAIQGTTTLNAALVIQVDFRGVRPYVGMPITGANLQPSTTVASFDIPGKTLTLSIPAKAAGQGELTLAGRAPGSSQKGSLMVVDDNGDGVWSPFVPGPAPNVSRTQTVIGMDSYEIADYGGSRIAGIPPSVGYALPGPAGEQASTGVARPHNIAWPGRMKLI